MSALILLAIVVPLILLNGTCVAAELALAGARRSRLESLARSGSRGAQGVLALIGSFRALDRSIATAQAGITLASLGLGMIAEDRLARMILPHLGTSTLSVAAAHALASAIALALLTYLHVVVGEVVPKTIALQHPVRTALLVLTPLRIIRIVLAPLVFFIDQASALVLRLLRIQPASEEARAHTLEEIQTLVEESGAGGAIAHKQIRILRNLLEFEDLPVRKVMLPRTQVTGLPVDVTVAEALEKVRETGHTRYPVYEGDLDRIVGFLHAKDLLAAMEDDSQEDLRARVRPVPHVPEAATARQLLRVFRDEHVHIAVVLDEHGGTAGIATFQDLLEEIFGEVQDEFDLGGPAIRHLTPVMGIVRGSVRLDEINEAFGLSLEERHVDTVGGLIQGHLGRTAQRGDVIRIDGTTMTVIGLQGLSITRVRVELRPDSRTPQAS